MQEEGVEPNSRTLGVRIQPEASGPPHASSETKSVRRAGKSPNMGQGLHLAVMVGHDPEDQGEPCETALRSKKKPGRAESRLLTGGFIATDTNSK